MSLDHDPNVSDTDKRQLVALQKKYTDRRTAIEAIPIRLANGDIDSDALQRKHRQAEMLDQEMSEEFQLFLVHIQAQKNLSPGTYSVLGRVAREEQIAKKQTQKQLIVAVEVRDKELMKVKPHLENMRQAAKADIEQSMRTSIKLLGDCAKRIPEAQQMEFHRSLEKMKEYHDALSQPHDDKNMKQLVSIFSADLARLLPMVKPVLAPERYHELADESNKLTQFNRILTNQPVNLEPPRFNDLAVPSVSRPVFESESSSMNPADSLPEEKQPRSEPVEELSSSEPGVTKGDLTEQGRKSVTLSDKREEKTEQEKINEKKIVTMKEKIFSFREQNCAAAPPPVDNPALEEKTVMLDEENQEELEKTLIRVEEILDIAHNNPDLSLEDKDLITTSKHLSAEILLSLREEVSIAKLESLQEHLLLLKPNTPKLNNLVKSIQEVMESIIDDTPTPNM